MEENGVYWGVVLNAGVTDDGPLAGMSPEAWDKVIHTNLDAFFNVLKPVMMPMVRAKQGGRIVTVTSVAGIAGNRGQTNYAASKGGLIAATKSLARELAKRKITVNSVAPGLIDTDMSADAPQDELIKAIPMRRLGKPEEVAGCVGYLFSDSAAYLTGEVIAIHGGLF
jgi:3-oxoacyl-[acyl-carrier protein] reductase